MFSGRFDAVCTKKNQITFPSKLKLQTGTDLLLANWFERCLIILPYEKGEKTLNALLDNASSLLPETRALERKIYSNAISVSLDEQGRFILPKQLKEEVQIEENVVFVGIKERIELWSQKRWEQYGDINEVQVRETAISLYNRIKNERL